MKILLFTALVASSLFVNAQQYSIIGTIPKTPNGSSILLFKRVGDDYKADTAKIINNQFTLKGTIPTPGIVYIRLLRKDKSRRKGDMLETYMGGEQVTLITKDSLSNAAITGSAFYDTYLKMVAATKKANDKIQALNKKYEAAYNNKNETEMSKIEADMETAVNIDLWNGYQSFIESNPTSVVALTAFENMVSYDVDYNKANPIWEKINTSLKVTETGKTLQNKLDIAYTTRVGAVAPIFEQNDVNNKPLSITSLKGKYVLIDFWASWCGPCRAENPNVVANYEKYKDKNFTILGVSLDQKKDKWLKAIEDDKLNWAQVSDLKGWGNEVATQYGIKGIPQNYLIDPNGIIVARNLREAKLGEKLAELLK